MPALRPLTVPRVLWMALILSVGCSDPAPSSPADIPDVAEASDAVEPVDPGLPPDNGPPDVPEPEDPGPELPVEPCEAAGCPPDATCEVRQGAAVCVTKTVIVETFDDSSQADPSTTADWGGGTLQSSTGAFGGDGADGAFAPTEDMTLDTSEQAEYHFSSFHIPAGVTVTVAGPKPLVIRVTGDASIDGLLRSQGQPGDHACGKPDGSGKPPGGIVLPGGLPGAGGGTGGSGGGGYGEEGQPGVGPGGGLGSTGATLGQPTTAAGAGGGGFGASGGDGTSKSGATPGNGGPMYGDGALDALIGGSGGGGGAAKDGGGNDGTCGLECDKLSCWAGVCGGPTYLGDGVKNPFDHPGGSGGGGGGAIAIASLGDILVAGAIRVDGGDGGWGDWSGAGGGGSGGAIRLRAWGEIWLEGGTLSARGGLGGLITCSNQAGGTRAGDGSGGRIRVESVTGLPSGFLVNPSPSPSYAALDGFVNGGTGQDGAFEPTEDVALDADLSPYQFTKVTIPDGVTLSGYGSKPLEILAQTTIEVKGTLDLSGLTGGTGFSACCGNPYANAHPGAGGAPGPGGFGGGTGGSAGPGVAGEGPGASPGGPVGNFSSAGGAGFAMEGQPGGTNQCSAPGPVGGPGYGDSALTDLVGGSGGGGAGDASSGACVWCNDGECMSTNQAATCPTTATCGSYCDNVASACEEILGCGETLAWNPGSGGGGGGGALRLQAPGLVRVDGIVRLNGGDGGDSQGASDFNDGTCGPECPGGCYEGICEPKGGGSFGGSGGGGSGGALYIKAQAIRAEGLLLAEGGGSGTLSQGGGCAVDPDAALPGQGRGGRGSPGRIRIETLTPTGSVAIGNGTFTRSTTDPSWGTTAQSLWYPMPPGARVIWAAAQGASIDEPLLLQVTASTPGGDADEEAASPWAADWETLPTGAFVRFRIELLAPEGDDVGTIVNEVQIELESVSEPVGG